MKLGVLFSGGKDSTFAGYLAQKEGHEIACLITLISENTDSFMFHTPSIGTTKTLAQAMHIPIVLQTTLGKKEKELEDLKAGIKKAIALYEIEGIVTGAVESVYQSTRIQEICFALGIECFNPLWQKDTIELLNDLISEKFSVIVTGVAAYPLDKEWLGRKIDTKFIEDITLFEKKYSINPAGEGGEFETLVLNCSLFKKPLGITEKTIVGEKNSWRMDVVVE